MSNVEYGIKISLDGHKMAVDGFDQVTQATDKTGEVIKRTNVQMVQQKKEIENVTEAGQRYLKTLELEYDMLGKTRAELERASAAAQKFTKSEQDKIAAVASAIDQFHREEAVAKDFAKSQEAASRASEQFINTLKRQAETQGMSRQELLSYQAAQLGVTSQAASYIDKLGNTEQATHKLNFATVGAKRELIVLAHEMSQGNFQKFGGSMMVLGEQTGAAGLLFSATGIAALGLVGAVVAVSYAMIKGATEQKSMNDALIMTNNYAGVSSDKLNELAHVAVRTGGSLGDAKKVVTELAASGKYSGEQIGLITESVIAMEHATGASVEKTIKQFESLAVQSTGSSVKSTEAIANATLKLDDEYHFLTEAVYEQIRALEKEGDQKGASKLATEEFANATKERSEEIIKNLGHVARAWNSIKEAAGAAIDTMGNWGKKGTAASDVAKYTGELVILDETQKRIQEQNKDTSGNLVDFLRERQINADRVVATENLRKAKIALKDEEDKLAAQRAKDIVQSDGTHAANQIATEDARLQKHGLNEPQIELGKYAEQIERIKAANPNSKLVTEDAVTLGIKARTEAYSKAQSERGEDDRSKKLQGIISGINAEIKEEQRKNSELQKLDDVRHQYGVITDAQYYEQKIARDLDTEKKQIEGFERELAALKNFHGLTNVERTKNANERAAVLQKITNAEDAYADHVRLVTVSADLTKKDAFEKSLGITDKDIDASQKQIEVEKDKLAQMGLSKVELDQYNQKKTKATIASLDSAAATIQEKIANGELDSSYEKVLEKLIRKAAALREVASLQGQEGVKQGDLDDAKEADRLHASLDKLFDPTKGRDFGNAVKGAVGEAINAIARLDAAMLSYNKNQQAYDAEIKTASDAYVKDKNEQKYAFELDRIRQKGAQNQLANYSQMAGAAKGFFGEGSKGYQAFEAAEKTLQLIQMAGTIARIAGIGTVSVAGSAASTVAISEGAAEFAAAAPAAIAKGGAQGGYVGMAVMAAAMAALGFATGTFGSSGGGGQSAAEVQKEQGSGGVFGDAKTKSDSITKSMDEMAKNTHALLPVNQRMLTALKNIESSMSGFTNLLVRTPGVIDGSSLGIQTGTLNKGSSLTNNLSFLESAILGGIGGLTVKFLGNLWGKTTQNIVDSGVQFGGKLSDLRAGQGFNQYASVDTTSTSWFGLKKSTSNTVQAQALSAELSSQMGLIFSGMSNALQEANKALGGKAEDVTKTLENLTLSSEKVSLKGLTGSALTEALNSVISKSLDEMAQAVFPQYDKFRALGEGYAQTVLRVANTFVGVNQALTSIGVAAFASGTAGTQAAMDLVKLSGGVDNFRENVNFFAENFLSDAERIAPVQVELHKRMTELGYGTVTTAEGFKNLVMGLDLTNAAQASLYAELMQLAPAFKAVADAAGVADALGTAHQALDSAKLLAQTSIQALANALSDLSNKAVAAKQAEQQAQEKISTAYFSAQNEVATAQKKITDLTRQSAEAMRGFSTSIKAFLASMEDGASGQSYESLRHTLSATAELAKGGDAKAQNDLTKIAQQFLDASKTRSKDASGYASDEASVKSLLTSVADTIDTQVKTLNVTPENPLVAAKAELVAAQNKVLELQGVANATGASIDKSMASVAGSSLALLTEFQKAHENSVKSQADFATGQALTGQYNLPSTSSMSGFYALLDEAQKAKTALVDAQTTLSAAIVKAAKDAEVSGNDFAASLGVSGANAQLLAKAMQDAHLSTRGYRALMATTGLTAMDLATELSSSGIAATDMAMILTRAGVDGEKFADRLTSAGISSLQFTEQIRQNGLGAAQLALVFDTSSAAASSLSVALGAPTTAAHTLALLLIQSSVSAGDLAGMMQKAGMSTLDLSKLLTGTGVSASDLFTILSITGSSATALANVLSRTGISAGELTLILGGISSGAADLNSLLKLTGGSAISAAMLATNIAASNASAQDFFAILGAAKISASSFAHAVDITGVSAAAILSVLGTSSGGLQGIAIASGVSLNRFNEIASAAGLSMSAFDKLLQQSGVSAALFDNLLSLTNGSAGSLSGYMGIAALSGRDLATMFDSASGTTAGMGASLTAVTTAATKIANLLNGFKLPTSEANSASGTINTTSLNQKIVEGWYKSNPNAIKAQDLEGIAYWISDINTNGLLYAKTAFANSVANLTNTAPLDITKFAAGGTFTNGVVSHPTNFEIGQMGEAGSEAIMPLANIGGKLGVHANLPVQNNQALQDEIRALREQITALLANTERIANATQDAAKTSQTTSDTLVRVTRGGNAFMMTQEVI